MVCGIDVNYDQEDDMYTVMINIGTKNLNKIFHPLRELQRNWYVDDIRKEVKNEIHRGKISVQISFFFAPTKPLC